MQAPRNTIEEFLDGLLDLDIDVGTDMGDSVQKYRDGSITFNGMLEDISQNLSREGFTSQSIMNLFGDAGGFDANTITVLSEPTFLHMISQISGESKNKAAEYIQNSLSNISGSKKDLVLNNLIPALSKMTGSPIPSIGGISAIVAMFNYLSTKTTNTMLAKPISLINEGLRISKNNPGTTIAVIYASQEIYKGMKMVYNWYNGLDNKQKTEISDVDKDTVAAVDSLKKTILSAESKKKDTVTAGALGKMLQSNMHPQQKEIIRKEFEDNVLSIIKGQLFDLLTNMIPLSEFSSSSMKKRAVRSTLGMNDLVGYPSSLIGIR